LSELRFADYSDRYEHVTMSRDDGILLMQLHSEGGPLLWGAGPHAELGSCFEDIARD